MSCPAQVAEAGRRRRATPDPARGTACLLAAAVLVAVVGCAGPSSAAPSSTAPSGPAAAAMTATGPAPLPSRPAIMATRVRIPAIGVDAGPLEQLGLLPDGSLAAPSQWQAAGVYADGPLPGERGPAVIDGHIDSKAGPAVFYRLRDVRRGDVVLVERSDGRTVTFRVTRVISVPKDAFPTDLVYGPTPDAELRLITCGGGFDRAARSYLDNTIAFATLQE